MRRVGRWPGSGTSRRVDDRVLALAFHPTQGATTGYFFASGSNGFLALYNSSDSVFAAPIQVFAGGHSRIAELPDLALDPERVLTVGSDRTAVLFDTLTSAPVSQYRNHPCKLTACALQSDLVCTGGEDGAVRIFDARAPHQRKPIQTLAKSFRDGLTGLVWRGTHDLVASSVDGTVALFDCRAGAVTAYAETPPSGPIGSLCGKGGDPTRVICTRLKTQRVVELNLLDASTQEGSGHVNELVSLKGAYHEASQAFVLGSENGEILEWRATDWSRAPARTSAGGGAAVLAVAVHPLGHTVVAGDARGNIECYARPG